MVMRRLAVMVACAAMLVALPARAVGLGVDVGAGTWLLEGLQADAHLKVEQELLSFLTIAARPGVAVTLNQPNARVAIPLDLSVKLKIAILYLEALGGLFWVPSSIDPLRAHVAGGVGVQIWKFQVGIEVGYLQPSLNLLARVGFTFF